MKGEQPRPTAGRPDTGRLADASRKTRQLSALVAVLGLVMTALLSIWLWNRADQQAEATLSERGEILTEDISKAMESVIDHLVALDGLYQASEEVTQSEFGRFISNFGVTPGVTVFAHAPVVPVEKLESFITSMRATIPGYAVFEFDGQGRPEPVGARDHYVPVGWLESAGDGFDAPYGFDLASETFLSVSLERASTSHDVATTSFIQLPFEDDADGFLVFWPIDDTSGEVVGYTVALLDLSDFLEAQISSALSDAVNWEVVDLTDGGEPESSENSLVWTTELDVGGRRWGLRVSPRDESRAAADTTSSSIVILAGVVASLLASYGFYRHREETEARGEVARLKELAAAKNRFLASASHALRTPLTSVLGFAEILAGEADDFDKHAKRDMMESIAGDARDLAAIIDDLVVSARSELDMVSVVSEPIQLRDLMTNLLETSGHGEPRDVSFGEDPNDDLEVLGDPARVRQIIRNMIANAHRYGGEKIRISCAAMDGHASIRFEDNGHGVPVEDWERMFEPYERLHDLESQPASLGIGLSVSRHLARLMGGDLIYRFENGWSTFELVLPIPEGASSRADTSGVDALSVGTG